MFTSKGTEAKGRAKRKKKGKG